MNNKINNLCATILDSIECAVFTIDLDFKITFFNHAAESITAFKKEEVLGKYCYEVLRTNACETNCPFREALKEKAKITGRRIEILDKYYSSIPVIAGSNIIKDKNIGIIGGIINFKDITNIENLKKEVIKKFQFGDIISKNHRILQIFDILPDIAESNSNLLIEGPSGSGKEVFARTIHNLSRRKDHPFIAVNCGALPDTLLESELFGYVPGAFTDAVKRKPGRFELANGGTLFLDEIGDTSPTLQVKLLRAIQEKTIEPLGSTKSIKVDVRIICATNKDLLKLVQEGKFREDLYYRINVIKITLPPLKERKEDIPLLIQHFIKKFNATTGKNIKGITEEALTVLMGYSYPGNIRELENIIEHAFVLSRSDYIDVNHLPSEIIETDEKDRRILPLDEIEKNAIIKAITQFNGNKQKASEALGIDRTTLWRKLKKYNINI